MHKRAVRVLAPTRPVLGALDAARAVAAALALDARRRPVKRPAIGVARRRSTRRAVVRCTGAVRRAVVGVVLVVLGEDGKGLLVCARVVAAFGGLDAFARFDGWMKEEGQGS